MLRMYITHLMDKHPVLVVGDNSRVDVLPPNLQCIFIGHTLSAEKAMSTETSLRPLQLF